MFSSEKIHFTKNPVSWIKVDIKVKKDPSMDLQEMDLSGRRDF